MATLRDIRRRISGVKRTQKITKAMKMVAAAKLRRAQEAILQARPYARTMAEMLRHLSGKVDVTQYPQLAQRPLEKVALVVVSADRGLCGAFNTNIMRATVSHIDKNYREQNGTGKLKLVCVGKKGYDYFNKRQYEILFKHIGIFNALSFGTARTIVSEIMAGYGTGEFDKVEIVYNEFKNAVQQRVVIEQFLPIPAEAVEAKESRQQHSLVDYIYEQPAAEIYGVLLPRYVEIEVYRALLESQSAELAARMTAMDAATTNAAELIDSLTLYLNRVRQAAITKEIIEIVSGAAAA